ncbi:CoA-transferase [Staphylococcus carnosus]|uniref:fatty acid degradation protein FadX n=1 Tax=Staphylococcus carnosus TaxID=1281 RepID=UPI00081AA264|nr:CoA-transferase [Staphylococcus carnosus]ANZ34446.1 acyl CoA:acetate/3-ketoacid CoA transferase [Staphylococcus carnosus]UTB79538.1 acyl CoA:acetate/3-ketoacid CoA transferase [Staphylococcus carnosus]UTB84305.1 acyl CoA:acetate/3-ketoacid CoA transferase [Staphylococcus carnosus]
MEQIERQDLQHIVKDGDVIGVAALTVSNLPAELLRNVLEAYDKTGSPKGLTFINANDISSMGTEPELDDFVERGMISRIIMSIMTASPKTANAIKNNEIEAYFLPQGVIATHYRQTNSILPGVITKIGLNTTIDPRYKGGRTNDKTTEQLVTFLNIENEDYLHYQLPPVDVALLRGTYADAHGNIYVSQEAYLSEGYSIALNAKSTHGTVVVQVKEIIDTPDLNPDDVFIPGSLVDYIYVAGDSKHHRQLIQTHYDPVFSGEATTNERIDPPLPFNTRKTILRRAAQFLNEGDTISIGFGINNELSNLLYEENVEHQVQPVQDIGIFGGFIGSGKHFGMNANFDFRLRHDQTWDFIYNGGISVAYLSFAEIDQYGNVNVSYFGNRMNGCGGFIDISQSVQRIIFSGSLVARSQLTIKDEQLEVIEEGTTQKFIPEVSNIDFNASYAKTLNQEVYIVTDRAVFELRNEGLTLIEIAPGLNLEKDVIQQMGFKPLIAKDLKTIDHTIYQEQWGLLAQSIH